MNDDLYIIAMPIVLLLLIPASIALFRAHYKAKERHCETWCNYYAKEAKAYKSLLSLADEETVKYKKLYADLLKDYTRLESRLNTILKAQLNNHDSNKFSLDK